MTEIDSSDNLEGANDHILVGDLGSKMDMNETNRTGCGDDEVEIVVCRVTAETTSIGGDAWALDAALNANKFEVDGTVYTFIVDLDASLKKDNIKERQQVENVLLAKNDLLPNAFEPYHLLKSAPDSERREIVTEDIQTIDPKQGENLSVLCGSRFGENEGEDKYGDSVIGENEVVGNSTYKNETALTVESDLHGEVMDVIVETASTTSDVLNDELLDVANERDRIRLIGHELSESILSDQEKDIPIGETVSVYNGKENGSCIAAPQHGEEMNALDNSLTRKLSIRDEMGVNDDSVNIINESVRSAQENATEQENNTRSRRLLEETENNASVTTQENATEEENNTFLRGTSHLLGENENNASVTTPENAIELENKTLLRETSRLLEENENNASLSTQENKSSVHGMSSIKYADHDFIISLQKPSKRANRRLSERHICKTCGKMFAYSDSLKRHSYLHTTDHPVFVCTNCSRTFVCKRYLQRHIKNCKIKKVSRKSLACNVCSKKFLTMRGVVRHLEKSHEGNGTISCEVCSKKLSGKNDLRLHMRSHNKLKQLLCDICTRTFNQKRGLSKHIKGHFLLENFDCKICLVPFARESDLIRHTIEHHPAPEHKDLAAVAILDKQQHQTSRDLYSCDFCLQSFKWKTSLIKHMEVHCRLDNLSCEICYVECSDQSALNRHMATHTLGKEDSIPCINDQGNLPSSVAKDVPMSNHYGYGVKDVLHIEKQIIQDNEVEFDSVLSATCISQEEKLALVRETVDELKGNLVHMNDTLESSVSEEPAHIGDASSHISMETMEDLRVNGISAENNHKGKCVPIKETLISGVNESNDGTKEFLTVVKAQDTEALTALEEYVPNLGKQEQVMLLGKYQSNKGDSEQKPSKAAHYFEFHIQSHQSIIKRESDSDSNINVQIKPKKGSSNERFSSVSSFPRKPDRPSFTCSTCLKKLASKGNVIRHMYVRHGICGLCRKSFSQRKELDIHMTTVHSTRCGLYFCDICNQTFISRYYLLRHIEYHVKVGKVVCKVCSSQFSNRNSLSHHMREHLVESYTEVTIKKHEHKRQRFYCDVCSQAFGSKASLIVHMEHHLGLDIPSSSVSQEQAWKCYAMEWNGKSKPKRHLCGICQKRFRSKRNLSRHLKNHSQLRFIPCKVCSKQFRDTTCLKRHMIIHLSSAQGKSHCSRCHRQLDSKSELRLHRLQHEGLNKCDICSQVFSFKSNLKRHVMQYHFKVGLLYCQVCGKTSQNKTELSHHMKVKHSGKN